MAWLAKDKQGQIFVYDYDETRKDGAHYSFVKIPENILKQEIIDQLNKINEPLKIE